MASTPRHTIAAGVVQDIVDELSLTGGTEYEVQNVSGYNRIIRFFDGLYNAGTDPPPAGEGNEVAFREVFTFTAGAAVPMWVWGLNGDAVLAINDNT